MLICTHKTIVLCLRFHHHGKSPRISSSTKAGRRRFDYVAHAQNVCAGKSHFWASSSSISLSMLKFPIDISDLVAIANSVGSPSMHLQFIESSCYKNKLDKNTAHLGPNLKTI